MDAAVMHGLFVGLTTLDLVYRAVAPPAPNQKLVASDYAIAAGGPVTNAAVTFAYLGQRATVLSVVGAHPMAQLVRADLQAYGVNAIDLDADRTEPPPISSIIVTEATGDRAVISINAVKTQATVTAIPPNVLDDVDIVLIDGHQMAVGAAIAHQAQARKIPVVMDGGSWKPGFETVLPGVNYAICSANFHPPDASTEAAAIAFLQQVGIPHIAITHGRDPIRYWHSGQAGQLAVPAIAPVDTLGAGDIFHGAFCHFILQMEFVSALQQAANIAAQSCESFGTRRWMAQGRV